MGLGDIQAVIDAEGPATAERAAELLAAGEAILEQWLAAMGRAPTHDLREGFRLLALHRQGAADDASFNACRESCRELVFHYNVACAAGENDDVARTVHMMRFVARHLLFFISGKLVERGLGEFCCASRPLRQADA